MDSKAECDQLNLAHKTKTKNASAQLVLNIISRCVLVYDRNVLMSSRRFGRRRCIHDQFYPES